VDYYHILDGVEIDLLAKLYRKQLAKVNIEGTQSVWFLVKKGVRQCCVPSPYTVKHPSGEGEMMRETLKGLSGVLHTSLAVTYWKKAKCPVGNRSR